LEAPYVVQLAVPAKADSVRLVRLVAASLAADASWTLTDIEDVRVAVSELVALLLEGDEPGDEHIHLRYQRTDDALHIEGRYELTNSANGDRPAPDDLALEILRVVVDEHELTHGPTERWFRLTKRARNHP
jgi:serine/threonine-protein kinase RsbW